MSQTNPVIGSGLSGLEYRNQENDVKKAMLSNHKGSTAPSYAEAGCLWLDDSATPWALKFYDGVDWIVISKINATTNSTSNLNYADDIIGKTESPVSTNDRIVFADESDGNNLKQCKLQAVLSLSGAPTGVIMDYAGASAPSGFLACDGSAVSRVTYASLFAAIGTLWGTGDGSTTFNLPNLCRRVTIGAGGTATSTIGNTVGSKGGAETHTLSTDEIPAHSHSFPRGNSGYAGTSILQTSGNSDTYSTSSIGGGLAHNNMQPSAVVLKIIKI